MANNETITTPEAVNESNWWRFWVCF
jgi:hypothetical protein